MFEDTPSYELLAKLDTVHDFWKQRGKQGQDDDDDDDEQNETKLAQVQSKITTLLGGRDINSILSNLTNNNVKSATSDYERKVEKYYESDFAVDDLYADCREEITFEEIISSVDNFKDLYYDNQLVNILEISSRDGRSFGNLSQPEKNRIANFVLNFMFYRASPRLCHFMFDGKAGIIGKIFRDIEQSVQLMTPQNIADSAPTSFTSLKGRTECKFVEKNISSNFFTRGQLEFSFQDNGFNNKNKYGFQLNITDGKKVYSVPFSESQTEGPSVNYLVDIMTCKQTDIKSQEPKKGSTLKIGKFLSDVNMSDGKIPFDLKRIGDHEQLRAAVAAGQESPIIFCTIDILCSLFARLKKQRCIFHVGEKLVLYRFPGDIATDPVSIELYRARRTLENLMKYDILLNAKTNLIDQLNHITYSIIFGRFIAKSNRNKRAEYIVTYLIIIRLLGIWDSLYNLINSFENLAIIPSIDYKAASLFLDEFIKNPAVNPGNNATDVFYTDSTGKTLSVTATINSLKFDINALYEQFKKLNLTSNELKILMNKKTGDLNLTKIIMDDKNMFFKKGSYSLFNLNMEAFSKLYDNLTVLYGIKNARSERARNISIHDKLVSLGYYDNVYNICNDMLNDVLSEQLRNILTLSVDNNDTLFSYFFGDFRTGIFIPLNPLMNTIIDKITTQFDSYTTSLGNTSGSLATLISYENVTNRIDTIQGGSISKIIGGVGDPQQYRDLSDVLREISGRAAAFVESIISKYNLFKTHIKDAIRPDKIIKTSNPREVLNHINKSYKDRGKELYDELNFIWESNIFLIRNMGDTVYSGYTTQVSEILLTFILSGWYNQDSITIVNSIIDHPHNYSLVATNDVANIITQLTTNSDVSWEIIVLVLLTLIDNIMTNPKESFFEIKTFPIHNFDTHSSWVELQRYIYTLLTYISTNKKPTLTTRSLFGGKLSNNKCTKHRKLLKSKIMNKKCISKRITFLQAKNVSKKNKRPARKTQRRN